MPLTKAGMSAAIKGKLDAKFPVAAGGDQGRQDFADAIAEAVVTYLQANAMVPVIHPMGPGKGTIL